MKYVIPIRSHRVRPPRATLSCAWSHAVNPSLLTRSLHTVSKESRVDR